MEEIWKDYIYNYQVSNLGNVRNKTNGKVLRKHVTKTGYYAVCVSLGSRNKCKNIRVHRAVAELFIPNPNNFSQVNHIDGDKLNNHISNLEWCTASYNVQHSYDNHLHERPTYCENKLSFLSKEDIDFCISNYKPRDKQYGMRALSRRFNITYKSMWRIIHGYISS